MPRRLKLALLLAFCLHGILILTAQYRLSYDAYNHMFFADHYLRGWWSLWEPRWYTGFEVTTYPPLFHQLIAALGRLTCVDAAFGLLLWAVLAAYPLAVYAFSRIFTGRAAASYAALGAALLPALFLAAHTFGQLPTLGSALLALFGAAALAGFLKEGDTLTGALAVSLFTAATAGHHATLLFQPWLAGIVLLSAWRPKGGRSRRLLRFGIFAVLAALAALAVIWPFWDWGRGQAMQAPIDHPSRHNFFADPYAANLFFLLVYGLLIPVIPFGLWRGLHRRYRGLGAAFLCLFLLGLGGTTPLPRLLFGAGWAWLTYDRFAFWASLLLLPFFGLAAARVARSKPLLRAVPVFMGLMALTGLIIGLTPSWMPTQPRPLDLQPIVDFLARSGRDQYRYLTFGFGDQMARLSRLTGAATLDGSYHTARTLPELRLSGVGQVDTAYWLPGGLAALDPILRKSGERGVRWGFVALKNYIPVLKRSGWTKLAALSNGVQVWENPGAVLPAPARPPAARPLAAFSWGVFPLLAFSMSMALAIRRAWPVAGLQVLSAVQALAVGLLPLGLTFWYFRPLFAFPHARIYFAYSDALFFLSDGLALVALLAWLVQRLPAPGERAGVQRAVLQRPLPQRPYSRSKFFARPHGWLFAVCLLASLSTLWSLDWRTSLYISAHLWLCYALFLLLRGAPRLLLPFSLGSCLALAVQFAIGVWQVIHQSTALAAFLGLNWPGDLLPEMSGASIVELADGTRWLRAYGALPHPNLLGGFALALLSAPLALSLLPARPRLGLLTPLPALIFNLALALMVLTFSRSAWLGLAVLGAGLLVHWKKLDRRRLALLAFTGLATLTVLFASLRPLFATRLGSTPAETEQVSSYTRHWLVERAGELVRQRPLLGAGVGAFPLALSQHVAAFYDIEPVHNLVLLVTVELGLAGAALLAGLIAALAAGLMRARRPAAVVFSAVLLGLGAASLFDHYLWTLAPGRLLLASMLGLWAGQVEEDERCR